MTVSKSVCEVVNSEHRMLAWSGDRESVFREAAALERRQADEVHVVTEVYDPVRRARATQVN